MADTTILRIESELGSVESSEDVVVLLAVESGSRAWGFPSVDSDYDVRFIYVHRPDWYLSIELEDLPDVLERPIHDGLDVCGWDIRKALRLFRKSNPPLLEWLQCPIVYRERSSFAHRLREILPSFYSPKASFFHYMHMARGNVREYLRSDVVWLKKYFYVLRPLMAMLWIEKDFGPVPIEFNRLVDAVIDDQELRQEICQLLEAKKAGAELNRGPRIPASSRFIETEMSRLERTAGYRSSCAPPLEQLNVLFRDTLTEVWRNIARGSTFSTGPVLKDLPG